MFVLSILVKLREHFSHIINEELGEFFVRLKDITEKLAVVIVNNVRKFFLEWKRLEIAPIHLSLLSFQNTDLVVEFKNFRRFSGDISFIFLYHSTKYNNIVRVKAKSVVVGDSHCHSDLQLSPNSKLCIISLD